VGIRSPRRWLRSNRAYGVTRTALSTACAPENGRHPMDARHARCVVAGLRATLDIRRRRAGLEFAGHEQISHVVAKTKSGLKNVRVRRTQSARDQNAFGHQRDQRHCDEKPPEQADTGVPEIPASNEHIGASLSTACDDSVHAMRVPARLSDSCSPGR